MKKYFSRLTPALILSLGTIPIPGWSQTQLDLGQQGKDINFSQAAFTRPIKVGLTLPPTCSVGDLFFKSNSALGTNLFGCAPANSWSTLGSAGSGGAGISFAFDDGSANNYSVSVPGITSYTDGLQVLVVPANSNTMASTLAVSGLAPVAIKTPQGMDTITPGTIRSGSPANIIYSALNGYFIVTNPAVLTQQSVAAGLGLLTDFTQSPPLISPDPAEFCARTQTCAPTGGQDLTNATFLIFPKLAADPPICTVGQVYYNNTTNTQHECTATNTWVDLGLGGGSGGSSGGGTGGTGATGPAGPAGADGQPGPAGQGYTWRGTWVSSVSYLPYDTIFFSGSSWIAVAANSNVVPGTDGGANWNLVAQQGSGGGSGGGGGAQRSFVVYRATNTTPIICSGLVQTLDAYTMPANTLLVGDVVDVFALFRKGGTTSGNTFTVSWPGSLTPFCCAPTNPSDGESYTEDLHYTVASSTSEIVGGQVFRANGTFLPARGFSTDGTADITQPFTVFAQQNCSVGDSGSMSQWWIRVSR
jgi:hypothetical protein